MDTTTTTVRDAIRDAYRRAGATEDFDRAVKDWPDLLPDAAVRYPSIAAMKVALANSGNHYFDRNTMGWFNAIIHSKRPLGGRMFVESVQMDDETPRQYRVCWVAQSVNASLMVEKIDGFPTLEEAQEVARVLSHEIIRSERTPK